MPRRVTVCRILTSLAIIACAVPPVMAQSLETKSPLPSRIVSPIDDSARVTIAGSKHRLATLENDIGPLDGTTALQRMILAMHGSPEQEHQLRILVDSQQTEGSPEYHHWLSPEEFGNKFGPSQQDVQKVANWLQKQGFAIGSIAKSKRWMEFSGTSAQVEAAFQTKMRQYAVGGETHVANASEISIPAALNPVVQGVFSLHNFYSKPMHIRSQPNANVSHDGGQSHAIAPSDFANIYNLNPLYAAGLKGTGRTIAIVAASNINLSDVATFRHLFGLSMNPPNVILNGSDPGVDTKNGFGLEATLDAEWAGAVAPGATIDVVVSAGTLTTDPVILSSIFITDQNFADVMSVSFGQCELVSHAPDFWDSLWEQAATQGISVFVATGDTGAAGCDSPNSTIAAQHGVSVNIVASTPHNTAIGGTEFNETVNGGADSTFWNETPNVLSSVNGYIPEMVWNESCTPIQLNTRCSERGQFRLSASGGGLSSFFATPSFQTVAGIPGLSPAVLQGKRGVPDVSLNAGVQHDPYIVCFTSDATNPDCQLSNGSIIQGTFKTLAGGTSAAAPPFAGIMAIVDQKLNARQGLANPILYSLAAMQNFSNCNSSARTNPSIPTECIFNDVTVGNNGVPGNDVTNDPVQGALGHPAITGYDLATGLGSVNAANLVNAWANTSFQGSQTTLFCCGGDVSDFTINSPHGALPVLTVKVKRAGGGSGPTGTAVLITSQGQVLDSLPDVLENGSLSRIYNLPGGNYNLFARYSGDGTFAASTSQLVPVIVTPEDSQMSLVALVRSTIENLVEPGNIVTYGDDRHILGIDANPFGVVSKITGTPATGNVTFTINQDQLTIPLDSSGTAEFRDCFFPLQSCLQPGQYTFNAHYSGDVSYNATSSLNTVTVTITKGNPSLMLNAPAIIAHGQQFILSTVVQPPPLATIAITGTVQFMDGTTALGHPVLLSSGQASAQIMLDVLGNHSLSAQYSGNNTYNGAVADSFLVNVVPSPFNFSATTTSQSIPAGGTAIYNLTLNAVGGFAGQISFTCTGTPSDATCNVSPNPASLTSTVTSVPLTVTVSNTTNARLKPVHFRTLPVVFAGLLAVVLLRWPRKSPRRILLLTCILLLVFVNSCGGGSSVTGNAPRPTNATLTITAAGAGFRSTINLNLTVTH